MQLSTREAVGLLKKLGFELVECKHHVRAFLTVNGHRYFTVHCSFGMKDLPGNVPHLFRKSLNLSVDDFEKVRAGLVDRNMYLNLLRTRGLID